jgi:hypothetical protein
MQQQITTQHTCTDSPCQSAQHFTRVRRRIGNQKTFHIKLKRIYTSVAIIQYKAKEINILIFNIDAFYMFGTRENVHFVALY